MGGGEASGQEGSCPDPAGGTQCWAEPAVGAGTGQDRAVGMPAPKSQLGEAKGTSKGSQPQRGQGLGVSRARSRALQEAPLGKGRGFESQLKTEASPSKAVVPAQAAPLLRHLPAVLTVLFNNDGAWPWPGCWTSGRGSSCFLGH